ncbi:hypothetical protein B0F90DRAFT_1916690 [Multifurca ochricompacta]|uniref:Uncharacterized protein n=1 Tax=Multifurca ochricompacta TaxID=376703 RepID=A0AAD4M7E6_9AGAM|nr:hypothetical protein B0F90DRAFT_1916690 [Multifurca ochricompacta]
MKSSFLSIVSTALFVAGVYGQSTPTVNTPLNVVVCQPLQLTWSGGTPPYFLRFVGLLSIVIIVAHSCYYLRSIHPGSAPDDPALADFGTQQGTSFLWTKVNFAVGTSLDITLRDSNGQTSQSAPFTVQTGGDLSCLNASSSSGSSASSAPATSGSLSTLSVPSSTVAPTTSASVTIPGTTSTTKAATTSSPASSASSSKAPSTSTTPNAAMPTGGISYGAVGVIGAVVAAVLA